MPPHFESRIIRCDAARFRSCHSPTIVQTLDGDLLACWSAGSAEDAADAVILSSRLGQQARHWTPPAVVCNTAGRCDARPVLSCDAYGSAWLFWLVMLGSGWDSCGVRARTSGDSGHSWDPYVSIQEAPGWLTRSKPVSLRSGEALLPLSDARDDSSFFLVTTDLAHWEPRGEIRGSCGVRSPSVMERADGSLLAVMAGGEKDTEHTLWASMSDDSGRSWSAPARIQWPNPGSAADIIRLANGHVILAFNPSAAARSPLALALSLDEGRNWRYVRDLEPEDGDFANPALIQSSDGLLHVVYSGNQDPIRHACLDEEWIREGGTPILG